VSLLSISGERFDFCCIYNDNMTPPLSARRRSKTPPPGETGQEALYLRSLSDRQVNIQVKLRDGETVRGWIEYFDEGMLRLTARASPISSSTRSRFSPFRR
jgi:host factor-I protein